MVCLLLGGQALAQKVSAPMQPPFNGRDREGKKVGDAGDGPLLEVAQLQHEPKFRRQLRQPLLQVRLFASAQQRGFRAGGEGGAMTQNERVELAVFGRLLTGFLLADPPGSVPSDGADPAAETGRLLQLRQRFERQQKGLLRQILGSLPRVERLHGDRDYRTAVASHQFVERLQVTQQGVEDQLLVADLGVSAAVLCHSLHSSCKEETAPRQKDRGNADFS
jgi:hypothetical protein